MASHALETRQRSASWRTFAPVLLAAVVWWAAYTALQPVTEFIGYDVFGLTRGSHLGDAVAFFLYDVPKILLLLGAMIFLITVLRTFFSAERTRQLLGGKRVGIGNILAAMLGIVTPFCSCSAVALFIGFVESGVPLGVTFSFLIAAPVINEVAIILLFGLFGWQVAALYISSGLFIAILSGLIIGHLRLERWVEDFVWEIQFSGAQDDSRKLAWEERFAQARDAVRQIVGKVWLYVVVGIAIGAVIHGYVPTDALAGLMGKSAWWSVPVAVLLGVPLYSNAAGMIPVVSALIEKGASLGTALAFMMAVTGVSLPETIILRRVLKPPLIDVFVGVVAQAIIATGYLFKTVL
jgi:uncharacterized membrane protein YraQ (UPF0718 family)